MIERTFIIFKPDAVQRQIVGEILTRFEKVGLKVVGIKMVKVDGAFAKKHYASLVSKPFYPSLEKYILEGPVIAAVLEGVSAVELVRKMVGATESKSANPGTIRGDFSHHSYAYSDAKGISIKNVIHASGNKQEADTEIKLWFKDSELFNYETVHEKHTL